MNRNGNPKAKSFRANRGGTRKSSQRKGMESALILYKEYPGQPTMSMVLEGNYGVLSTTVTSGAIALSLAIAQNGILNNFAARFLAFDQFRVVKAVAKVRLFSTQNPGVLSMFFSEDNSATPTAIIIGQATCKRFPASDVDRVHTLSYVPHDPAQQTWTTVAAGNPTIGYFKLYTDNAAYGSSIVATQYLSLTFDLTVQFRGLI